MRLVAFQTAAPARGSCRCQPSPETPGCKEIAHQHAGSIAELGVGGGNDRGAGRIRPPRRRAAAWRCGSAPPSPRGQSTSGDSGFSPKACADRNTSTGRRRLPPQKRCSLKWRESVPRPESSVAQSAVERPIPPADAAATGGGPADWAGVRGATDIAVARLAWGESQRLQVHPANCIQRVRCRLT